MSQTNSIPRYDNPIPLLTTEQMIEVDRLMIEDYRIELIQMMENAGRCLAIVAKKRFLGEHAPPKKVAVLAGTGGNGGGALVCARRLASWGFAVEVFLSDMEKMTPVPQHQLDIVKRLGLPVHAAEVLDKTGPVDLIVDGIIGYSIIGDPFGAAKTMIDWANAQAAPVLALDTPSGIDLSTGTIHQPCIQAEATLTLALPKRGLYKEDVKKWRGELYLGDISVPPQLYAEPSLGIALGVLFQEGDILLVN